jgi:hypothetical protein
LLSFSAAVLLLSACDATSREWKTPNMTSLPHRLQSMFEKTKTICFGRFMIDVPASSTIVWSDTIVPLTVKIYPNGVDKVKGLSQKFISELKSTKAIYLNHIPLLISIDDVEQPEGQVITGYEGFEAIAELKINGYFRLNNDGIVINARPLKRLKDETITDIKSIARRLRQRSETEVPTEAGNCIESAFLPDSPDDEKEHPGELVRIGFRLQEIPDVQFSVEIRPSNYNDPESDSLERQWKRTKEDLVTPDEKKILANTKFFRQSQRQIHEWKAGYEVLTRSPDEERSYSHHDFEVRFVGVGHDPYKPYADIQFQTGVADNAAGATKASLTDEEAIAVWDKITSTIRVRPTSTTPAQSTKVDSNPRLPLGEVAATGRTCPQTGWWVPTESDGMKQGERQYIKADERMPHVVSLGEPSIWQKLTGERPTYRAGTVWKLVSYDAPTDSDVTIPKLPIAQVSPSDTVANDLSNGAIGGKPNEITLPENKG